MEIYMDNAATTPVCPEAAMAMRQFFSTYYYNPSAGYSTGRQIRKVIEDNRSQLATLIGAEADEIYFTSGGTESDNWAINEGAKRRVHIISTPIEHKAVLKPLEYYAANGGEVSLVRVNKEGLVDVSELQRRINSRTGLISVMLANNEIGTIEPIETIGHIAHEYDILFHTDAVQAFGHIPIDVKKLGVDMLSVSAHKFGGPKGIGFMYIGRNAKISAMIRGGSQEKELRAGTENVPGIVGMTAAAKVSCSKMEANANYCRKICKHMQDRMLSEIRETKFNGAKIGDSKLPNNLNVSFAGIDAASLLALLDMNKIKTSAGSACSAASKEYSHVLQAIGLDEKYIGGTIRLSISEKISLQMSDYVVNIIKKLVNELRNAN